MKKPFLMSFIILFSIACSSQRTQNSEEKKATLFYNQGTNNLVEKEYTMALKNLLEAYKYRPNDPKILNNLGMAYYLKKSPTNAKRFLKRALKEDPKNSDARMNLATIFMEEKNYGEAEKQYKEILEDLVFTKQYKTYHNLSKLEMRRNNKVAAMRYLQESIKVNENYCPAFYDIGVMQFKSGSYKEAERSFKEASMGLCYKMPEPRFYRAKSLVKMNQYFEATKILEEMTETFAMTKWEATARKGINKIKNVHDKKVLSTLEAKNSNKAISTPDF
jgi:type IV pilus assembly protein PilF